MKKLIFIFSFFVLLISCNQKEVESSKKLSVMTYNMRYLNTHDGDNIWKNRLPIIVDLINDNSPDLIGTQELVHKQITDLNKALDDYNYFGVGRLDGKSEGEYAAIFYKKNNLELVDGDTFWLAENIDSVGAKGWDAACERIVTWAEFKDGAGKQLFLFNTHFDHVGEVAKRKSAELLLSKVNEVAGNKVAIITGDFNSLPESTVYKTLIKGKLIDLEKLSKNRFGPGWSYNGFTDSIMTKIDYVFTNKELRVEKAKTLSYKWGNIYPSDHLPIIIATEFN